MQWLNEPASWQRTSGVLTVSVDPGTDFWRQTSYGYIRDSGHVYGEVLAGDLDVSVRIRCTLETQYDQAGIMLRADEQTWLKTGVEFFEGQPRLSTVLTLGRSSWTVTSLPEDTDEIVLRVARRDDAVEVRYGAGAEEPSQLAALVYLPPEAEVLAGVMCAAPEGPGFIVSFHDLHIDGQRWDGEAAPAAIQADGEREPWAERDQDRWAAGPDGGSGRRWLEPDEADVSSAGWTRGGTGGDAGPAWAARQEGGPAWAGQDREAAWPAADAGSAWAADGEGGQDAQERAGWPEPATGTARPPWADAAEPGVGPYWPETGTGGGRPGQRDAGSGTAWPPAAQTGTAGTGAGGTGPAGTGTGGTRAGGAGSGEWPASPAAAPSTGDWSGGHAAGSGEWPAQPDAPGTGDWPARRGGSGEWPAQPDAPGTGDWPARRGGSGEWPAQPAGGGSGEWPAQPAGGGSGEWSAQPAGGGSGEWPAQGGSGEWPVSAGDSGPGREVPAGDGPAGGRGDEPGPERGGRDRARKSRPGRVRIGRDRPGKDRPGRERAGGGPDDGGQPGAAAAAAKSGPDTAADEAGQATADSDPWRTVDGARTDADPDLDWFRQVRSDGADGEAAGAFGLGEGSRPAWPGPPAAADPPAGDPPAADGTGWPVPADARPDGEASPGSAAGPGAAEWRRPDSGSGADWMQLATSAQARHWIAALASDLSADWPGPPVPVDSTGGGDAPGGEAGLAGAEPGGAEPGDAGAGAAAGWAAALPDRAVAPQDYPADAADDTDPDGAVIPAGDTGQPDGPPWARPGDPWREATADAGSIPAPAAAADPEPFSGEAADTGSVPMPEVGAGPVSGPDAAGAAPVTGPGAAAPADSAGTGADADTGGTGADSADTDADAAGTGADADAAGTGADADAAGTGAHADPAEAGADADTGEMGAVPGSAGDPGTSAAPGRGAGGPGGLPPATGSGESPAAEQRNGLPQANGGRKPAAEQRKGLPAANGGRKPAAEPGDAGGGAWSGSFFSRGAAGADPAGPAASGEGLADDATDPNLPVTPDPEPAQPAAPRPPAASAGPALAGKTAGRPGPPAEPMDAADEWISLLTTDPADD